MSVESLIKNEQPIDDFYGNLELSSVSLLRKACQEEDFLAYAIRQQVWDEEATRLAEVLDGPIETSFEFYLKDNGLVSRAGNNLKDLWEKSAVVAAEKSKFDNRYEQLSRIRAREVDEAQVVESLARGQLATNSILVISPYPEEIAKKFGSTFVNEQGFNSRRKLAFIRQFTKIDGGVQMITKSVDNSDNQLWAEIIQNKTGSRASSTVEILSSYINASQFGIDDLINEYDQKLSSKSNCSYSQGRVNSTSQETYNFINSQRNLLDYNFQQLEKMANSKLSAAELLPLKQKHTYGIMATLEARYNSLQTTLNSSQSYSSIEKEVSQSGSVAQSEGKSYTACGISLSSSSNEKNHEAASLAKTLQLGSKDHMYCVSCPFCHKTVDAKVTAKAISCPSCQVSVDKKTGKILSSKQPKNELSFGQLFEQLLSELFSSKKR